MACSKREGPVHLECQSGEAVGLPRTPLGAEELGRQKGSAQMPAQGPKHRGAFPAHLAVVGAMSHRRWSCRFAQWGVETHLPSSSSPGMLGGRTTLEQTRALLGSVHGPLVVHVRADELFQVSQNVIISFSFPFQIVDV